MTMEPAVSEKLHPYHCQDGDQDAGPASNDAGIEEHHGGDYVEGNASYKNHRPNEFVGRCYHKKYAQDNCSSKQKLKCSCIYHNCYEKAVNDFAYYQVSDNSLNHRGSPFSCTTELYPSWNVKLLICIIYHKFHFMSISR